MRVFLFKKTSVVGVQLKLEKFQQMIGIDEYKLISTSAITTKSHNREGLKSYITYEIVSTNL